MTEFNYCDIFLVHIKLCDGCDSWHISDNDSDKYICFMTLNNR